METIFKIAEFKYKQFFEDNEESIRLYNGVIYPKIVAIGAIAALIALIGSYFNEYMHKARMPYGIICVVCLVIYFTRKTRFWRERPIQCMYMVFGCIFVMLLYMSVGIFQNGTGASILVLLTIFPVSFLDRPERLFMADAGMYLIHTVSAFLVKDVTFASLDLVNGLIATIVGCVFGFFILNSRLHALNFRTLLTVERETDVLTTLYNRRKMTETIEGFEHGVNPKPTGIIMMDIDHFKEYNDTYGHVAGDKCLSAFGNMLRQETWDANVIFYRYGGEEFIGFVWDTDKAQLAGLAEAVHAKTEQLEVEHRGITISTGYVYCENGQELNFETWIQKADQALYTAKGRGRNCVASCE